MFCSILESAAVRSEMEVVPRCENDVQVDALTVVDLTMLMWFVSHFTVGATRLLLSSRASLLGVYLYR